MYESRTLPDVLAARVAAAPRRPFVAMVGAPPLTLGEIDARSRRVASGLADLGVGSGDRVLVMLPNCIEFVEAWFAINRLGAVLVTVNTAYRGGFLEHVANDAAARVMIVAAPLLPVVDEAQARIPGLRVLVVVAAPGASADAPAGAAGSAPAPRRAGVVAFDQLRTAAARASDAAVAPHDISAIVYTSGTTGRSKGVLLPHAQMYLNAHVYLEQMGVGGSDVVYCALPLFHTNALTLQVYGALIAGCTVHLAAQFSASRWLDDIRATGATVTNLLGVMTEFVHRQPARPDDADNPLRIASAVPIAPAIGTAFEARFGVQLVELYGSTEINCPLFQPRAEPRRDGSCGKVVGHWFECRIADADTDVELPDGAVGELQVRPLAPDGCMAGYNGMPEATLRAWRNLWFHTGDAMRRDADGYYYFVDRMKDCIRRRAENISSFEVEQAVLEHAAVAEVAAIGVDAPACAHEQEVKLCVVRKPGARLDAAELHAHCRARMPAFAVPRYIEFLDELPKTPTLKVKKQALRERGITRETWEAPEAPGERSRERPTAAARARCP